MESPKARSNGFRLSKNFTSRSRRKLAQKETEVEKEYGKKNRRSPPELRGNRWSSSKGGLESLWSAPAGQNVGSAKPVKKPN